MRRSVLSVHWACNAGGRCSSTFAFASPGADRCDTAGSSHGSAFGRWFSKVGALLGPSVGLGGSGGCSFRSPACAAAADQRLGFVAAAGRYGGCVAKGIGRQARGVRGLAKRDPPDAWARGTKLSQCWEGVQCGSQSADERAMSCPPLPALRGSSHLDRAQCSVRNETLTLAGNLVPVIEPAAPVSRKNNTNSEVDS
jgi:hypothetical protein